MSEEQKSCATCRHNVGSLCYVYYEDGLSTQVDYTFVCDKWTALSKPMEGGGSDG